MHLRTFCEMSRLSRMNVRLILKSIAVALSLSSGVIAADAPVALKLGFIETRIQNSQEISLFPERIKLPRALFGTYNGFKKDTLMLKIRCGVNESVTAVDAEGKESQEYAALYRAELYRLRDDGDGESDSAWEYIAWYRFTDASAFRGCQSIRDTAVNASARRPLFVDLKIQPEGGQHRNVITGWKLEER